MEKETTASLSPCQGGNQTVPMGQDRKAESQMEISKRRRDLAAIVAAVGQLKEVLACSGSRGCRTMMASEALIGCKVIRNGLAAVEHTPHSGPLSR